jgi:hypothetical protein
MPLKRLEMNRVFTIKDPNALSKIFILQNRESFRKSASYSTDVNTKIVLFFEFISINFNFYNLRKNELVLLNVI